MNSKMIGRAIYLRFRVENKIRQLRNVEMCRTGVGAANPLFSNEELSDVSRLQQVQQKAVGWQRNLELISTALSLIRASVLSNQRVQEGFASMIQSTDQPENIILIDKQIARGESICNPLDFSLKQIKIYIKINIQLSGIILF